MLEHEGAEVVDLERVGEGGGRGRVDVEEDGAEAGGAVAAHVGGAEEARDARRRAAAHLPLRQLQRDEAVLLPDHDQQRQPLARVRPRRHVQRRVLSAVAHTN